MLIDIVHKNLSQGSFPGWEIFFTEEIQKKYFNKLNEKVSEALSTMTVYPPRHNIFRAFSISPKDIKCIIIGQDPYHEPGQAMGLSFSVQNNFPAPPSLKNIKKELADDLGMTYEIENDLSGWMQQGVFLINTALTVEEGKAGSHSGFGWKTFVKNSLSYICDCSEKPLCVILWGKHAQGFKPIFENNASKRPILIIESAHPSPLSVYRGFWGSKPFSKTNEFFKANGFPAIDWYSTEGM